MSGHINPMLTKELQELIIENEKLIKRIQELQTKLRKLEEENERLCELCGTHHTAG
ncbi:MAG TPA: hypothetical protein PKW79_00110 [Rhabdochlamydiaceae bacterium]|nr:hypothetical protein [Rhabdochlamydiaceae bacterium]